MLRTKWHVAWLIVWFLGTCIYTVFFVAMLVDDRMLDRYGVLQTAGVMLGLYTLPVTFAYIAGLVAGWILSKLGKNAWNLGHRAARRLTA
jgi:hypothetical protein